MVRFKNAWETAKDLALAARNPHGGEKSTRAFERWQRAEQPTNATERFFYERFKISSPDEWGSKMPDPNIDLKSAGPRTLSPRAREAQERNAFMGQQEYDTDDPGPYWLPEAPRDRKEFPDLAYDAEELMAEHYPGRAEADSEAWGGKPPSRSHTEWLAEGLEPTAGAPEGRGNGQGRREPDGPDNGLAGPLAANERDRLIEEFSQEYPEVSGPEMQQAEIDKDAAENWDGAVYPPYEGPGYTEPPADWEGWHQPHSEHEREHYWDTPEHDIPAEPKSADHEPIPEAEPF